MIRWHGPWRWWHDCITLWRRMIRWHGPWRRWWWWCRWWGSIIHSSRAIHSRNTIRKNTIRRNTIISIRFFKDPHFPGWEVLVKFLYMIKREVCGILWHVETSLEKKTDAFGTVQASMKQPEGKPCWSQRESHKQSVRTAPWTCKTTCFAWWMTWQ